MPLYEYQCEKCGHRFEKIQKFSDRMVKKCPECGGRVEQMISAPAVQFKGSGWYVTDYANKSHTPSPEGGGSDSKKEDGSKSKSDDSSKESSKEGSKESSAKDGSSKDSGGSKDDSKKTSSSKESSSRKSEKRRKRGPVWRGLRLTQIPFDPGGSSLGRSLVPLVKTRAFGMTPGMNDRETFKLTAARPNPLP